jgi:hypothetical protein
VFLQVLRDHPDVTGTIFKVAEVGLGALPFGGGVLSALLGCIYGRAAQVAEDGGKVKELLDKVKFLHRYVLEYLKVGLRERAGIGISCLLWSVG